MARAKQSAGSLSGLIASNKRVGPVDPKGAYTKVQEKTLAGAKGKAVLKKDKKLGATKMSKKK
jgi:glycine/serine hydroxymethyltransferase